VDSGFTALVSLVRPWHAVSSCRPPDIAGIEASTDDITGGIGSSEKIPFAESTMPVRDRCSWAGVQVSACFFAVRCRQRLRFCVVEMDSPLLTLTPSSYRTDPGACANASLSEEIASEGRKTRSHVRT